MAAMISAPLQVPAGGTQLGIDDEPAAPPRDEPTDSAVAPAQQA